MSARAPCLRSNSHVRSMCPLGVVPIRGRDLFFEFPGSAERLAIRIAMSGGDEGAIGRRVKQEGKRNPTPALAPANDTSA